MKIVYCIAGTFNSGGMERVLTNKANWLVRNGHEVVIVTTDQRGREPFFTLDERIVCYDLGINYEENNGGPFWKKLCAYPLKQWRHQRRLSHLLKELAADITVSMFCNDVAFIPSIRDGSQKVVEIHFSRFKRMQYARQGIWKLADRVRSWNDGKVVSRYAKFVVLTEEDKGYWGEMGNIEVIPNMLTHFPTKGAELANRKVLAVGRLTHQKGFDELVKIWSRMDGQRNGWTLDIVGGGELQEELQQLIRECNVEDSVTIVPPNKLMEKWYQQSSILVMTSRYEGLPMVLLEALSHGLPIVSYKCKCGPKDVIDDGRTGFLVDEGDRSTLVNKLHRLMVNERLRKEMGQAAMESAKVYGEEEIMKKWTTLFETIMKRR